MTGARRGATFEPEEESIGLHRIGLTAVWAFVAVLAVTVTIVAGKSDTGARRLSVALDGLPWPSRGATSLAEDAAATTRIARDDAEARALAETVRTLATDRDRLMARIGLLERDRDITASVPRRQVLKPPVDPASSLLSGPSLTLALTPEEHASAGPMGAATNAATESVIIKTEFGIDLGTAPTVDGLRALWSRLKAQHGALLNGLRPVAALHEGHEPCGVVLRLVAGPLANAAAAARLCATLAGQLPACRPATFEGQRLAAR